jgi:exosortase F-associated protein
MLNEILNHKKTTILLILSILGLVLIRAFEDYLFYDPFLQFFKNDYQNKKIPVFDGSKLFFGLFFRYTLNTLISLGIIYLIFKQMELVNFAAILFLSLFGVLIILLFGLLHFYKQPDYLILFYIRRFLIQPIFLVLFIPAFYYQQKLQ